MRVGFIGLGTMGSRMASNLMAAGHQLVIHDLEPLTGQPLVDLGAAWAVSPAAVAGQVEVVFTSLPGPAQVEAVALSPNGIIGGALPGLAFFDLSTNSPTVMRRIHGELSPRGVHVFDAPVSGGPDGAAAGRLAIWAGGDPEVFEAFLPVLRAFSDAPYLVGAIGAGSVAKLVHNASGYIIQTALAETFTLGVKAGVDPESLWQAVRMGALGRRRTFDTLSRNFLPGRFDPPDFALELARKDVALACELAREFDVPMRLANLTLMEMTEAMNRGWARRDSRSTMLLQEERSGVEVRIPAERIAGIIDGDPSPAPVADPAEDRSPSWFDRAVGKVRGKARHTVDASEAATPTLNRPVAASPATTAGAHPATAPDLRDQVKPPSLLDGAAPNDGASRPDHPAASADGTKPPSLLDQNPTEDTGPGPLLPVYPATGEYLKPPSILDGQGTELLGGGWRGHVERGHVPDGTGEPANLELGKPPSLLDTGPPEPFHLDPGPGPDSNGLSPASPGETKPPSVLDDLLEGLVDEDAPAGFAVVTADVPAVSPSPPTAPTTTPTTATPIPTPASEPDPSAGASDSGHDDPGSSPVGDDIAPASATTTDPGSDTAEPSLVSLYPSPGNVAAANGLGVDTVELTRPGAAGPTTGAGTTNGDAPSVAPPLAASTALGPEPTHAAAPADAVADGEVDGATAALGIPVPVAPTGWFYGWTVVSAVFLILMVTSGLGFYNVSVILEAAVDELNAPVGAVSGGAATFFGISGITAFVLAKRMEKVDLRWYYLGGGLFGAGALFSLRWVHTVLELYAFFAVFGIGFAMAGLVPGITLVTRWFQARRSIAISIASTGLSLGGIALTPVASNLIGNRGLAGAAPTLSLVWLLGVIPIALLLVRSYPADKGMGPDGVPLAAAIANQPAVAVRMPGVSFLAARRTRFFVMMCLAYAFIFFSQVGGLAHLFSIAEERTNNRATASVALSLLALTSVAGRLLGGVIVLKVPTKMFSMILVLLQAVALTSLALSFSRISILASAVFLGVSVGNLLMLQPLLLAEAFGVAEYSRIYSFNQLFSTVGVASGPVIVGLMHDWFDYQTSFIIAAVGSLLGFLAFAAAGSVERPLSLWDYPDGAPAPTGDQPAAAPASSAAT